MKNLLSTLLLALAVSFMFSACEGPAGADGLQGPEGPAGVAGADGQDGVNAAETCTECHNNSQLIATKELQYMASGHATRPDFERNGADCAPCHTSQGFLEVLETGATTTSAAISNPLPPNCYTCHNIHSTYTEEDWGLTLTEAVPLLQDGAMLDVNGSGKMCVGCHMARKADPFPVSGGADVAITSSRWGPHHGVQGNVYAGMGAYEFGTPIAANHPHLSAENSCNTCHMAEAYGIQAGGHSLGMTYEYHGAAAIYTAGCASTACHTDDAAFHTQIEEFEVEIEGYLTDLAAALETAGIYNPATGLANSGTFSADIAGAYFNFKLVEEDLSTGIHNPKYAKNVLVASIAALAK